MTSFIPIKYLLMTVFIIGSGMVWFVLLSFIRLNRTSRLSLLVERARQKNLNKSEQAKIDLVLSPKERAFISKARLAGLPREVTLSHFKGFQFIVTLLLIVIFFLSQVPNAVVMQLMSISNWVLLGLKLGVAGLVIWFMPVIFLSAMANSKKTQLLMEISKLSNRLSLCVTESADVRDMILRAARPLKLIRPHIQELAALWGKDQRAAIWQFKESVGITEIFPLVNALLAISEADSKDVVLVLHEQTKSIDATLESEVNKRIENAPIWISFYIMIPFAVILFLFLYPWVVTVSKQLLTSFSAP